MRCGVQTWLVGGGRAFAAEQASRDRLGMAGAHRGGPERGCRTHAQQLPSPTVLILKWKPASAPGGPAHETRNPPHTGILKLAGPA